MHKIHPTLNYPVEQPELRMKGSTWRGGDINLDLQLVCTGNAIDLHLSLTRPTVCLSIAVREGPKRASRWHQLRANWPKLIITVAFPLHHMPSTLVVSLLRPPDQFLRPHVCFSKSYTKRMFTVSNSIELLAELELSKECFRFFFLAAELSEIFP